MLLRHILLTVLMLPVLCTTAQTDTIRIMRGVNLRADTARIHRRALVADSMLAERYYSPSGIDTMYIQRPSERLTLKVRFNVSGAVIRSIGRLDNTYTSRLAADNKGTMSLGATYMGLTVGMALNPGALTGHYKDYEINVNSYGNRMGLDFAYQHARNFTGWIRTNYTDRQSIADDVIGMYSLNLNAYYAFNSTRFSYPAAFTQSYIQRRSAGSWLLAVSFQGQRINIRKADDAGTALMRLHIANLGIGGGYGHNFVMHHGWMVHVSLLPTLVVASTSRLWQRDQRIKMHNYFPEVIMTGRSAVIHSWKNYFAGTAMMFTYTNVGRPTTVRVEHNKWMVRTFVGMRL